MHYGLWIAQVEKVLGSTTTHPHCTPPELLENMYFTCTIYSRENCALVGVINQKKDSSTIV
jgi:hypothetical protein